MRRPTTLKAMTGAGAVAMMLGAFLVWAPGVGAQQDSGGTVAGYDIVDHSYSTDEDADTTTFQYKVISTENQDALSHVVAGGFCVEPSSIDPAPSSGDLSTEDPSTGAVGYKFNNPAVGTVFTFVFDGVYESDPAGSTWTIKKQDQRTFTRSGPDCDPPGETDPCVEDPASCEVDPCVVDPTLCETPPVIETVEPASLQVTKVVEGDVPEDWEVNFTGDLGDFPTNHVSVVEPRTGLEPGLYTVTEIDDGLSDLSEITCEGASAVVDLDTRSVTVDLVEGADAECTFTNVYPVEEEEVVLGDVVEIERDVVATPAPAPEETVTVADEAVVRSLPRTGSGTERLAGIGAALLAFGAVLVLGSQRRLSHLH